MRKKLLRATALSAAVLLAAAVYVVVDGPGGIAGLVGGVGPETRVDQVLAGISAETPYIAVLQEHRPDVYGALRETLVAEAEAGKPVQRLANEGRRYVSGWLAGAIATAPDPIAMDMLAVTTAVLRELAQSDPQTCAAFADGGLSNLPAQVSVTLRGQIDDIHMRLAAVPADHAVVTLPQAEIEAANGAIGPALEARFGADMALLGSTVDPANAARACEIQIAMLEAYAGFAPARAAAVARTLLAGAEGAEATQPGS